MNLGKPIKIIEVPAPERCPAEAAPLPVSGWPLRLPAEWPRAPQLPVVPARPSPTAAPRTVPAPWHG
jgi:hypothetical protein